MEKLKFVKLNPNAKAPSYGTQSSAGADLYALLDCEKAEIHSGETLLVKTGIAMQIPEGYAGLIFARSGIATKRGLAPANKVGLIDSDYRGEIMVPLHNHTNEVQTIENGERIAQIMITPYLHASFCETDTLDETERNLGGFGSTGSK